METPDNSALPLDDLRTIEGLEAERPDLFGPNTLRWQLRDRKTNGLDFACVRVGRRILISKSRYEQWLASRAGKQSAK